MKYNMYQELVDRINELLEENRNLKKENDELKDLFNSIPKTTTHLILIDKKIPKDKKLKLLKKIIGDV